MARRHAIEGDDFEIEGDDFESRDSGLEPTPNARLARRREVLDLGRVGFRRDALRPRRAMLRERMLHRGAKAAARSCESSAPMVTAWQSISAVV